MELNSILAQRYSGLFTYGAGLLEGLAALNELELVLFCGRKAYAHRDWLEQVCPTLQPRQFPWSIPFWKARHLAHWWRRFGFPSLQRYAGPFDLYHCHHHLMPPTRGKPRLLTVHDLRRYRYPQFYPRSRKEPFENAVRRADHFIAISHTTRRDLREFFDIPEYRIDVVYHGGPLPALNPSSRADRTAASVLLTRFGLQPNHYFLALASYDKRKNLPNTIRAFVQAASRLPADYKLVIVGHGPAEKDVFPSDITLPSSERVVCTGPLPDFTPLMEQSTALVYTSLYEGFGLPLLEAMSAGAPVICSNCSALPEVAGPAARLVDPHQPEDIAAALVEIAGNEEKQMQLTEAGFRRAAEFSWQRAAVETLAVYQKLITGN